MRVLDLFGKYFVLMMAIQGAIVGFYDSEKMKKMNWDKDSKLAKKIGIGAIFISVILYVLRIIII
ncbi:hypothetical protein SH2C18_09410 [Clostridium sediminicola]|uniref:CLC_0170 family protein n=1 Tax=Clostridium sediminicola TaxID=3114879 RepID=UPI0031F20708